MCKPISEGGQRCAAHTRTAYQAATPGTREWDDAAAAYASTPTGQRDLQNRLDDLTTQDGEPDAVVATEHALRRGAELRAQAIAIKNAIADAAAHAHRAAQPDSRVPLDEVGAGSVFDDFAAQQSGSVGGYLASRLLATEDERAVTDQFLVDAAKKVGWSQAELQAWANDRPGQLFSVVLFANRRVPDLNDRLAEATRRGFLPR